MPEITRRFYEANTDYFIVLCNCRRTRQLHEEWKKGATMRKEDWARGEHVDYKEHHLRAPPRGYEWRQVDGNYVLAAVATGVIASAIVAAEVH
jgi:Ni/Co efflux regulator RcnB